MEQQLSIRHPFNTFHVQGHMTYGTISYHQELEHNCRYVCVHIHNVVQCECDCLDEHLHCYYPCVTVVCGIAESRHVVCCLDIFELHTHEWLQ